jgi:hypothetical protein
MLVLPSSKTVPTRSFLILVVTGVYILEISLSPGEGEISYLGEKYEKAKKKKKKM